MNPTPSTSPPPAATTLTARTPEDLLAAAAVVLGFWPTGSVVMLTFGAAHRFHARVDLPDTADADALACVAESLARPAAQHRTDRVVLLLYSDDELVVAGAWRRLREAFDRRRIGVVEALHVGGTRWRSLLAPRAASRSAEYDRSSLAAHPFLAEAVLAGRVTRDSRAELAGSLAPDTEAIAVVSGLAAGLAAPVAAEEVLAEGAWAAALVARHLADGDPAGDTDAARLLVGMLHLRVRDAAWSAITRDRAREATGFFGDLVRRSPPGLRQAAAALLGWSAWQSGDGALAWCAVDRCDEVRPGYGLADLLAEALERAVPPTVWHEGFDWREGLGSAYEA